jgi:hypothetical protein
MLDMFMHKEINVLGASNNVMQSQGKFSHYLDYWPNFRDCRGTTIQLHTRSRSNTCCNIWLKLDKPVMSRQADAFKVSPNPDPI